MAVGFLNEDNTMVNVAVHRSHTKGLITYSISYADTFCLVQHSSFIET